MKVFEFYFNPKLKNEYQFRSFHFRPPNNETLFLGDLYILLELYHPQPEDQEFFFQIAETIKNNFYKNTKLLPEENFHNALKKLNALLNKRLNAGETRWMGNFHLIIINTNNFYLHFSSFGNNKILLLRDEELLDLSQELEEQKEEQFSSKPFVNFGTVKIIPQDKIFILTTQVFEKIYGEILEEIVNLEEIVPKKIKKILKDNKDQVGSISGILTLILLERAQINSWWEKIKMTYRFIKTHTKLVLILSFLILLFFGYLLFH